MSAKRIFSEEGLWGRRKLSNKNFQIEFLSPRNTAYLIFAEFQQTQH